MPSTTQFRALHQTAKRCRLQRVSARSRLEFLQLMCIVCTERLYLIAVHSFQFPDSFPVTPGHIGHRRVYKLRQLAARVFVRLREAHLAIVYAGIPTVYQPLIPHTQRSAAVPARMTGERDKHKPGFPYPYRRRAIQATPLIALECTGFPLWNMHAVPCRYAPVSQSSSVGRCRKASSSSA